jgi:hypothetical protein
MIIYLLNTVTPKHTFKQKLENLFLKYPNVDKRAMGFPPAGRMRPCGNECAPHDKVAIKPLRGDKCALRGEAILFSLSIILFIHFILFIGRLRPFYRYAAAMHKKSAQTFLIAGLHAYVAG